MTDMDRLIETVAVAIQKATEHPIMIPCPRCEGRGYHYGFGKNGCDPDWCDRCGGSQCEQDPTQIPRAAIAATLRGIREPSAEMIGTAGATVLNRYVGKDPAEHYYGTAGWAHETYTAMIDQAIKEVGGGAA